MSFSLLIPTFHRPARLARCLHHLSLQFEAALFDSLKLEIIIADGFDNPELNILKNENVNIYLEQLANYCKISVLSLPNISLSQRIYQLSLKATNDNVMLLGDDDLIILKNCESLLEDHDDIPHPRTISGRLLNITGLKLNNVDFNVQERPYVGYTLDHPSGIVRISQYFALNAVGTNALAYSIQSKEILCQYSLEATKKDFFYGGLEMLHQTISLLKGPVFISEKPLLFRDFTYLDYNIDPQREAPDSDQYPYHGLDAVLALTGLIADEKEMNQEQARLLVDSILLTTRDLQKSRTSVRDSQLFPLKIPIEPNFVADASLVWKHHLKAIYSPESQKKIFLRRIPGFSFARFFYSLLKSSI